MVILYATPRGHLFYFLFFIFFCGLDFNSVFVVRHELCCGYFLFGLSRLLDGKWSVCKGH